MFKVGDRVMCLDGQNSGGVLYSGEIYTIDRLPDPFTIGSPKITLKEHPRLWFLERRFILAINEKSPYTVWDAFAMGVQV